jgi:hypothetical protein
MSLLLSAVAALTIAGAGASSAKDYTPAFQPAGIDDKPAGPPNEVMVLGTPHLAALPDSFRLEMVDPLVARLVAWRPTDIAVEHNSGLLCDKMRRMPERYKDAIESYCFDTSIPASVTGLDVPAANAKAEAMLGDWPQDPPPALRRELAAVFLAAGEPASALVQWLRLPADERKADAVLTKELVDMLHRRAASANETYSVAARVAAASGLDRLWSVDDQSTYIGEFGDRDAFGAALEAAWDNPSGKARAAEAKGLEDNLGQPDGLLSMYRAYNAPAFAGVAYRSDFGAALTEPSEQGYGRRYVAYWETRNLRMVANIREVLGRRPGSRILAIVGASHKGYYEAYLDQMRDVVLVDVSPVLK